MIKKIIVGSGVFLLPMVVLAQGTTGSIDDFNDVIGFANTALNAATGFLLALAVVYVLWGTFEFLKAGEDEERKEGRNKMVYGIIGIAVMVSVWSLVKIITGTFGFKAGDSAISGPAVPIISPIK